MGVHLLPGGRWIRRYQAAGLRGLQVRRRGRQTGINRQLSPEQERQVQKLLSDKTSDQLNMPFALWTRAAVQALLHRETKRWMPIRTVGEYLKRWGLTVQKPKQQAYEQRLAAIRRWGQEEYPAIQAQAKREQAEIAWGAATGLRTDCQPPRGYVPKGPPQSFGCMRSASPSI